MRQPISKEHLETLAQKFEDGTTSGSLFERPFNDDGKLTLSVTGVLLLASIAVDLRRIADAVELPRGDGGMGANASDIQSAAGRH